LILPFVTRVLDGTEFQYSLFEVLFTIGFVVGSLAMAKLANRLHEGQWIVISILGMGLVSFGFASVQAIPIAMTIFAITGILNAPSYVGRGRIIQRNTTRETLLINEDLIGRHAALDIQPIGVGAKSYLGVPIVAGDNVIGVLSAQSTRLEGRFDEHHLRLLSIIAANVGVVFENPRLFHAAQDAQLIAEHANTAKSTFLANMSHELRTPLNAIISFTRIVRRHAAAVLPQKQIENLDRVLVSADHLLGLINTMLDIAKIEAGRMEVQATTFAFTNLVDICLATTQPLVRPGVSLEKRVDPNVPPVHSDPEKVKQIVLNLLGNAAKFTETGKITTTVRAWAVTWS